MCEDKSTHVIVITTIIIDFAYIVIFKLLKTLCKDMQKNCAQKAIKNHIENVNASMRLIVTWIKTTT